MEMKTRERRLFHLLCGLLVLMACCFRTGAVLQEGVADPTVEQPEPFLYIRPTEPENRGDPPIGEEKEIQPLGNYPLSMPTIGEESIDNRWGGQLDIDALLQKELSSAIGEDPWVLILHTHGSEAYGDKEGYRSDDPASNVIRVGAEIAQALEKAGIPTIHDTTAYDLQAGYNSAYEAAAKAIETHLDNYPRIRVVIDVHRDAAPDGQGGQKALTAQLQGTSAAAMMLVMGTDTAELPHENWQDNLAFALRLQDYIGTDAPGIMRKISLRSARYNEHFTPCSLLLEVGSAGNSLQEAICSGRYFGQKLGEFLKTLQQGGK